MFSVSNRSRVRQPFRLKGGGRATLAPGETKSLALDDRDHPFIVGREFAGVIAVAKAAAKAKPAPARDPVLPENPETF